MRRIMAMVCLALVHCHQRGVIHRDVKPGNIRLMADGSVRLGDFGISRMHDDEAEEYATDACMGTASFMAAELLAGQVYGGFTDAYAVGVTGYYLLTGELPFKNVMDSLTKPAPPLPPTISAETRALISGALDKEPSTRFSVARLAVAFSPCPIFIWLGGDERMGAVRDLQAESGGKAMIILVGQPQDAGGSSTRLWRMLVAL
jgi:serine/threonine protein kinase